MCAHKAIIAQGTFDEHASIDVIVLLKRTQAEQNLLKLEKKTSQLSALDWVKHSNLSHCPSITHVDGIDIDSPPPIHTHQPSLD